MRWVNIQLFATFGQYLGHGRDDHPDTRNESHGRNRPDFVEVILQIDRGIDRRDTRVYHDVAQFKQLLPGGVARFGILE